MAKHHEERLHEEHEKKRRVHKDEKEDKKLVKKMVKSSAMKHEDKRVKAMPGHKMASKRGK